MNYISVEEAIPLSGLRVAFVKGVPSPWGLAARVILDLKKIEYIPVGQEPMAANDALKAWTGHNSAPVAVLNDERPRAGWAEILLLAERLAPTPAMIPADEAHRIELFGLSHEICGEDGLGWCFRLFLMHDTAAGPKTPGGMRWKYFDDIPPDHARKRMNAIINNLAARATAQKSKGIPFLLGDTLTAVDIYWAAFSGLMRPLGDAVCPVPEFYQNVGGPLCAALDNGLPDILVEQRDHIAKTYFNGPLVF
ncbi:MAG: hypothetical protein ABWZ40_06965 [Caulobacterales bacterium]